MGQDEHAGLARRGADPAGPGEPRRVPGPGRQNPSLSFEQPAIANFLAAQPGPFRIDSRTEIESLWQPDTALLYGFEDVGGIANPLALAETARYWEGMGSRSSPLYDLLNIRYVIARKDVTLDWDKFILAFDGDPNLNVYENRRVLPCAFVAGGFSRSRATMPPGRPSTCRISIPRRPPSWRKPQPQP